MNWLWRGRPERLAAVVLCLVFGSVAGPATGRGLGSETSAASAPTRVEDLQNLSIEQLSQIEVTSVSKAPEALNDAAASIFVITHDDIVRSGATSIPDVLRLAPNLQVQQTSASQYVITSRGFSGETSAQNFSNKLLVLIDGRSVYTPLYSGVYWDVQDVLLSDVDRIEVISGAGATLWGANAVNGVINIVTRKSSDTQGGLVDVSSGNFQNSVSLRYGGKIGDDVSYRVYAKDIYDGNTLTSTGANAHDHWSKPQGGVRLDWTPSPSDLLTLQGDAYSGSEAQDGAPDQDIHGANILGRWNHAWQDGSALQVQGYYDHTYRGTEDGGGHFALDTYDLDAQDSLTLWRTNQIVWGGGVRVSDYNINGTATLLFEPARRILTLSDIFAQDTLALTPTLKMTLGLKLEDDPYSGVSTLPNIRLSWKPVGSTLLWASASRAIRSPTPFDVDVVEKAGTTVFLTGNRDFKPEKVTDYEVGARAQLSPRASLSITSFYSVYDDLRSIEPAPAGFIPLDWGNLLKGSTYGVEAWGDYQVTEWWRLSASYNWLSEHFTFKPGASGLLGVRQLGDDPAHQAALRSAMNIGRAITLDADLRYVGQLPDPHVASFVELNGRVGWRISESVTLSLSGFNLLHDHHLEFPGANTVPRSVMASLQWRY